MTTPDLATDGQQPGNIEEQLPIKRTRRRERKLAVVEEKFTRLVTETRPDGRNRERRVKATRWKIVGLYEDGRRKREYFADEESAKGRLSMLVTQRENLGARAAKIAGGLAEDAVRAERELAPLRVTLAAAVSEYVRAYTELADTGAGLLDVVREYAARHRERKASLSVVRLGEAFLKDRETNGVSRFYLTDSRIRWRRLEEYFGSDTPASDVTPDGLSEFLDSLGVGAVTRGNFQRNLGTMFAFGVKRGYVPTNPFAALDKPRVKRKRPEIFTPKQMKTLLSHAPADWLPGLAIGAFAGLRPFEILRLDWRHVHFDSGLIEVEAAGTKVASRRLVTMPPTLRAWLAPYERRKGRVTPPPGTEKKRRYAAMKAAGIETWPVDVLRHSFASYHLAAHQNAAALAEEMGNSVQMIRQHYRELVKPDEARKWWALVRRTRTRKGVAKIIPLPRKTRAA